MDQHDLSVLLTVSLNRDHQQLWAGVGDCCRYRTLPATFAADLRAPMLYPKVFNLKLFKALFKINPNLKTEAVTMP